MSRIGKKPIPVPKGVTVTVHPDAVEVKGPKGTLKQRVPPGIKFEVKGAELAALTMREDPELNKFHGLARSLMANAVHGVTEGFKRELDIVGVGYRAELKGKQVVFALGYSHPIVLDIPTGIDIAVEKQTHITVTGADRQLVGTHRTGRNGQQQTKTEPASSKFTCHRSRSGSTKMREAINKACAAAVPWHHRAPSGRRRKRSRHIARRSPETSPPCRRRHSVRARADGHRRAGPSHRK